MVSRKSTDTEQSKGARPPRAAAKTPAAVRPKRIATPLVSGPPKAGDPVSPGAPDTDMTEPDAAAPLKKQELIATVVERADVPRKYAKPVIEAMLAVLGDALGEGRDLNLEPMGKIKRKRLKDTGNARVIVANIRQAHGAGGTAPLAGRMSEPTEADAKEAVADGASSR